MYWFFFIFICVALTTDCCLMLNLNVFSKGRSSLINNNQENKRDLLVCFWEKKKQSGVFGWLFFYFIFLFASSLQSLQNVLRRMVISVVWRRLRRGWVRGVRAPHQRLATARADLKTSVELAWTMLVLSLFQAIMVRGKKRLFVLFCVVAWDFKTAVMVSGLVMDWILDNVVWAVWRTDISAGFLGGLDIFQGGSAGTSPPTTL